MIKILLVEDDKIIVASLSEYLNSEGYLVRSVSGQAAAMKLLAEEKADLVLLDVSLAEGNGISIIPGSPFRTAAYILDRDAEKRYNNTAVRVLGQQMQG